ncbi:MAG: sodium:solute symporter [Planctomycetes bacterium]|nr:sodium:solute symporter [Planctomycetota bacterium]
MPLIDLAVLVGYLVLTVGYGCWFTFRTRTTEAYMAADRNLPGWAVGLSIFGSYISSISFLANPGKSFDKNWNFFAFSLATPIAAAVAVRYFVPFYRRSGEVSAYQHLEARFGPWARTYAVVCYLLTQVTRTGTIIYLLALAVAPLTGWRVETIIVLTGLLMTSYSVLGGIEAVIWVGVVHSLVLLAGPLICLVALFAQMPEGPGQIIQIAAEQDKFSLGSFAPDLTASTFWVVLLYGLTINIGNFGVDQGYVQRYITARSDGAAKRSVWLGALLYVPVAAVFFFIGTALFAFYTARPELMPADFDAAGHPDRVFPLFIVTRLPAGVAGLVIAGIFAAAMDPSLNSMATLTLRDLYQRYFRPAATERESLRVLRLSTLLWGIVGTSVALALIQAKTVLDRWWELAGIFSGGVLGLFLLGLISRRAGNAAAATGVGLGILVIVWMTLSPAWSGEWAAWRNPFNNLMTTVVGTLTILLAGLLLSRVSAREGRSRW